jgi:hypothetical protein
MRALRRGGVEHVENPMSRPVNKLGITFWGRGNLPACKARAHLIEATMGTAEVLHRSGEKPQDTGFAKNDDIMSLEDLRSFSRDNALLRGFLRENPGAKETKRNLKRIIERIASI